MGDTTTFALNETVAAGGIARLTSLLAQDNHVIVMAEPSDRLPARLLASVLAAMKTSKGFIRFEGLSSIAQAAVAMVDIERLIAIGGERPAPMVGDRPFVINISAEGGLHITLNKGAGQHHFMSDIAAHEWIRGIEVTNVTLNLADVEHLNSLLVAWMLQINQGIAPNRCRLANVSRQAAAQLVQLRLNHLLTII